MKRETARTAFEQATVPVSSANISTDRTRLACIVTVHEKHWLSGKLGFVFDELNELCWAPASYQTSEFFTSFPVSLPHFHSRYIQFLKSNSITICIDDCFAYAVVGVSDKPSFSSAYLLQVPFSGASACSLKASLNVPVFSFDLPKFPAVEELIGRSDGWIIDPTIYSENCGNFLVGLGCCFNNNVNDRFAFAESNPRAGGFSKWVLFKIGWDLDSVFFSSFKCGKTYFLACRIEFERVVIERDRTEFFFNRSCFEFESFKHVACLVSDCSNYATVQERVFLPDCSVSEMMQSGLVECFFGEPGVYDFLTRFVGHENSVFQVLISDDSGLNCKQHTIPLYLKVFKCTTSYKEYAIAQNKACDIQHQLPSCLVSKIQETSSCWKSQGNSRAIYQRKNPGTRVEYLESFCTTRPRSSFHFSTANFFTNVYREDIERIFCKESDQGTQIRGKILESELLCRNSWYSNRESNTEVYSGAKEVKAQFLTASKKAVSPCAT